MLNICESTNCNEFIDELISKDIALSPKTQTPLAQLVSSSTVSPLLDMVGKTVEERNNELAVSSDNSLHIGWTNEIVDRCSAIMNRRIDAIRVSVLPTIKSISDTVLADVAHLGESGFNFNIVRYSICDSVYISKFMEEVKRFTSSSNYLTPTDIFKEESLPVSGILEVLKTNMTALDDANAVAAQRIGDDNLLRLWESVFVDPAKSSFNNYSSFDNLLFDRKNGFDYAILIFQLASNLESKNSKAARSYKEAAAFYISRGFKDYSNALENGVLIKERQNEFGSTVVYTLNYNTFLQKGGTAEVVIGAANSDKMFFNVDDILNNVADCMKNYNLVKASNDVDYRQNVRNTAIASLRNNFTRSLKYEMTSYEEEYFKKNPAELSVVINKFENLVSLISSSSVKDIYRRICDIVCNSRFYYMDCYGFLKNIDNACEDGSSPEVAFSEAIIDEITDFICSQIKV